MTTTLAAAREVPPPRGATLEDRLAAFLAARMGTAVRVFDLARCSGGGSRETWMFTAEWHEDGEARQRPLVLRRDPPASLLDSDREREFRVLERLQGSGIPVPDVAWFERTPVWLDRPFMIMGRAPGMPTPPTFPSGADPAQRARAADDFVRILAAIHRLDWRRTGLEFLPGLDETSPPALVQLEEWRRLYVAERLAHEPLLDLAFRRLEESLPESDRVTLVHGDFRTGNYLIDEHGRITAMLDWEMAHLGDPMEDLGWACMDFWSGGGRACGLLDREDFFARYTAASGIAVDRRRVAFYELLGDVKMTIISMTGLRSLVDGRAADVVLAYVGFLIPRLLRSIARRLGVVA
jgi:aminoglycoside phosphotransferase (APT) family kinase protein